MLSSNEELQSTNEELETTKEELQSANEELTTVNEQFMSRNRELDALTDDLSNFISSADLPMVTVGRDLRVRRLTPAAQKAFNLLPTDVGRSIEHIKFSLAVDDIAAIIDQVIASGAAVGARRPRSRWPLVGAYACCRSAPATIASTARRSWRSTSTWSGKVTNCGKGATPRWRLCRRCANRWSCWTPIAASDWRMTPSTRCSATRRSRSRAGTSGTSGHGIWAGPDVRRSLKDACAGKTAITNLEMERSLQGRGRTLVLNTKWIAACGSAVGRRSWPSRTSPTRVRPKRCASTRKRSRLVDKRKDEFLGILAHELRNPLAPMRFALEIMRRADSNPDQMTRARQVLERQVTHMVRIVDDLLDVSRITQGKVELRKERLELAGLVNAAVELCRPGITAARHMLTVSLPDETVALDGDAVRLTQVLVNLLNNAIKFTPPAGTSG